VTKYGLPTSSSNPVTLAPLRGGQPGDERLHWNTRSQEVGIPCPVLPGDPAFDELPIGSNLELGTVTKAPMFPRWFASIQYIHQHNQGQLLYSNDALFTWSKIDTAEFDNLPLLLTVPSILLEVFRFSQDGTPMPNQAQLPPTLPSTGGVSAADLQILIQHLRAQPAAAPVPTTTSAERERAKESDGAEIKYHLIFCRTVEAVDRTDPSAKLQSI
jgi:hypothetical protein